MISNLAFPAEPVGLARSKSTAIDPLGDELPNSSALVTIPRDSNSYVRCDVAHGGVTLPLQVGAINGITKIITGLNLSTMVI